MKMLRVEKNPGFLYDLFNLFVLYFNQTDFVRMNKNPNLAEQDVKFFEEVLQQTERFPEELGLFFRMRGGERCFLLTKYFYDGRHMKSDLEPAVFPAAFSDRDEMVRDVAEFYFGRNKQFPAYGDSGFLQVVGKELRALAVDAELKNSLYAFFVDPDAVLKMLAAAWKTGEETVSRLHKEARAVLSREKEELSCGVLQNALREHEGRSFSLPEDQKVSFCVLTRNLILRTMGADNDAIILLGVNFGEYVNFLSSRNSGPELEMFGMALGEKNRLHILDLILERGEVTVAEMKEELTLSHTNAYYHLTMLQRAGVLKCRTSGRVIYYSINPVRFEEAYQMMAKYRNAKSV